MVEEEEEEEDYFQFTSQVNHQGATQTKTTSDKSSERLIRGLVVVTEIPINDLPKKTTHKRTVRTIITLQISPSVHYPPRQSSSSASQLNTVSHRFERLTATNRLMVLYLRHSTGPGCRTRLRQRCHHTRGPHDSLSRMYLLLASTLSLFPRYSPPLLCAARRG